MDTLNGTGGFNFRAWELPRLGLATPSPYRGGQPCKILEAENIVDLDLMPSRPIGALGIFGRRR